MAARREFVGRERSINAVDAALSKDRIILLATQKEVSKEDPDPGDVYSCLDRDLEIIRRGVCYLYFFCRDRHVYDRGDHR